MRENGVFTPGASSRTLSDQSAQAPAAAGATPQTVNTEGGNYYAAPVTAQRDFIGGDQRITVRGNAVFVTASATAAVGLVALSDLMQSPEVWSAAGGFRSVFESLTVDIAVLADLKSLHDLLYQLYYNCMAELPLEWARLHPQIAPIERFRRLGIRTLSDLRAAALNLDEAQRARLAAELGLPEDGLTAMIAGESDLPNAAHVATFYEITARDMRRRAGQLIGPPAGA